MRVLLCIKGDIMRIMDMKYSELWAPDGALLKPERLWVLPKLVWKT